MLDLVEVRVEDLVEEEWEDVVLNLVELRVEELTGLQWPYPG